MSGLTCLSFFSLYPALALIFLVGKSATDEILGCGGFIKSHADIDFSQITVKLFTKTGSLKDQTECAPNTGYYFLPVYDKGEYFLKLDPPRGWSFEPTEVLLNIDGSSADLCSQGKDINFIFKGFGITGKVVIASAIKSKSQPTGISVLLYDQHNKTLLGSTVTSEGGAFSFTPIQPGKYVLVSSHPIWLMEKHSTNVTVREGNTELKDGELSVFGFDVSGRVTTTDGEPVGKVSFLLFGNGQTKNCATDPVEGFNSKKKSLCHVISDETGRFLFPALSPGEYILIPYYAGSRTRYVVKPSELAFTVVHDSLILSQEFKVTGFTISGKVMASIDPLIPLVGAKVYLSRKQIAITDNNGAYTTDNVKAKQYMLYAEAKNVKFEEKPVKVSPTNPELPTITPIAFKLSGKISSTIKTNLQNRKILIKNLSTNTHQLIEINSNTGAWYIYLTPAKYQLTVIVTEEERSRGLQFFPLQRVVDVTSASMKDVTFLQLKATLKGAIICLPNKDFIDECTQSKVTLKMIDGVVETKTVKAQAGEYIFEDVLPGHYEVIVDTDTFCWDTPTHQIAIESEKPPIEPIFWQTGYSVTFISSHDIKLEYSVPNQPTKKTTFELLKGNMRHCVPIAGTYEFFPIGCHKYSKPLYTWNTNDRTPIILSSSEHLNTAFIRSSSTINDISINIEVESTKEKIPILHSNTKPLRDVEEYKFIYTFAFNLVTGERYVISPSSESLLFDPPFVRITGSDDCQHDVAFFHAEEGKTISGLISPPLEGASIKIFGKDEENPVYTLSTQQDGTFKVGPLDGSINYSIIAEKEGFIITRDSESNEYKFLAHKLAEISVKVIDSSGSTPLQGVLLSLSGGSGGLNSYRKNIMTGEEGKQTFHSLSPGEYYLRPTMKEYRFEPSSKMIRVEEGKTVVVTLVGRRVAFSAYGTVTCLNGEPESGLLVEARGQAECSDLQEEATTKEDGTWRIRGLEPKCMYAIRLKLNEQDPNSRTLRAIPSSIAIQAIQDIHDIKLMALQPVSRTDVSVRIFSNTLENYRTLKVKLCRDDVPDSPIHIAKIDSQYTTKHNNAGFLLHFPPLQADGKKYFIQLESSLSKITHEYKIFPVYFEANSSFKFVDLNFIAERKHEHGDANQITFVPLPLIVIVTAAFFHREALSSWLNTKVEKWSRRPTPTVNRNSQASAQNLLAANDSRADDIIVEQIKNINSKTSKKVKSRKT